MTNLTEKWNKGELPSGYYYVYLKYLKMFDIAGRSTLSEILKIGNGDNVEVLAEVPSYKEYQKLLSDQLAKNEGEEINAELEDENTKLKELLKECKHIMSIEKDFASCHFEKDKLCKLLTKIDQVLGEE